MPMMLNDQSSTSYARRQRFERAVDVLAALTRVQKGLAPYKTTAGPKAKEKGTAKPATGKSPDK